MKGKIAERLLSNVIMAQAAATLHVVRTRRRDLPPLRIPQEGLKGRVSYTQESAKGKGILGTRNNIQNGPKK